MTYPYDKLLDFNEAQDEVRLLGKDWEISNCAYVGHCKCLRMGKVYFWQLDFEHIAPYLGIKPAERGCIIEDKEWRGL
jgi:hypothetical protein